MKKKLLLRACLAYSFVHLSTAQAAVIAIVDSGVDYKHPSLSTRIWTNPGEIPDNGLDDDGGTFIDDVLGWNFAENNNQIIDYKYLGTFSEKPARFFEIQKKALEGTATEEDKAWVQAQLADKAFLKEVQIFGNFVHGTHVAGIAAGDNPNALIMTIKLIPTEVKLPFGSRLSSLQEDWGNTKPGPNLGDFARDLAVKQLLAQLAKAQGTIFGSVGSYVNGRKAQVANLSLGTSTQAASNIIEPLLKVLYGKNRQPTQDEIQKYAKHMVSKMLESVVSMPRTSPATLFVIAAGNDGTDNDVLPVAPANLREPNTLTVAATLADIQLAPFSNYGAKMVDVAAPGVGILSSIPGGENMFLSGTSQAAPFVAHVAGLVLGANEALAPSQVREVLMGTVDSKPFLQGKVVSGGMVNTDRAVRAAALTKQGLSLVEAIEQARYEIADARYDFRFESATVQNMFALPLPSTFVGQKE